MKGEMKREMKREMKSEMNVSELESQKIGMRTCSKTLKI